MIERLSHGPASVHGFDGALSTVAANDFKTYCNPGAGADCDQDEARTGERVQAEAEAIKTVSDWAVYYRRFWEESFDKLEVVVNQMKKTEMRDDRKRG